MVNKPGDSEEPPHSPESSLLFVISLLCVCVVILTVFNFVLQFKADHASDLKLIEITTD